MLLGYAAPQAGHDQCFTTTFNAVGHPPPLQFAAVGLIFVVIGVALLVFRKSPAVQIFSRGRSGWQTGFAIVVISVAIIWTTAASASILHDWWSVKFGPTKSVAGTVEQFHPMPFTGHDTEHFMVDGVRFDYSDSEITSGFNQTSSHGGPVRAGLLVRIHYVALRRGPTITKLELAC